MYRRGEMWFIMMCVLIYGEIWSAKLGQLMGNWAISPENEPWLEGMFWKILYLASNRQIDRKVVCCCILVGVYLSICWGLLPKMTRNSSFES